MDIIRQGTGVFGGWVVQEWWRIGNLLQRVEARVEDTRLLTQAQHLGYCRTKGIWGLVF